MVSMKQVALKVILIETTSVYRISPDEEVQIELTIQFVHASRVSGAIGMKEGERAEASQYSILIQLLTRRHLTCCQRYEREREDERRGDLSV